MKKIIAFLLSIGPGIFCIGYTVGTGSVTSMAKAGSQYGSAESFLSPNGIQNTYILAIKVSKLATLGSRRSTRPEKCIMINDRSEK